MGRSVSHKAIICYKRLVEQKSPSEVVRKSSTVPMKLNTMFSRLDIQLCVTVVCQKKTRRCDGHSLSLVRDYLNFMSQFKLPPSPNPPAKEGVLPTLQGRIPYNLTLQERMVYNPTGSNGQMTRSSVPDDLIHPLHF